MSDGDTAGMAWWNGISETERARWLAVAGSARAVDAWTAYKAKAKNRQMILIVGSPLGDADEHTLRYLSFYDPNVGDHGRIETTDDIGSALVFDDVGAAHECWKQVNRNRPVRPDGKPNRPLTAYTVEFVRVP